MADIPEQAKKLVGPPVIKPVTMAEAHPPVLAYSDSATAAVTANGGKGDGVRGETNAATGSGVVGVHLTSGNGVYGKSMSGNAGAFDGNVHVNGSITVTGDVYLPGADCAEQFDASGVSPIEPGTLVIVDRDGALKESENEYDRKVVGVVAGAGTYRPGIVLDKNTTGAPRVVVSLMGKAYCKVDADRGAVEVGDLLTSSPTPGYAMKAADQRLAFGAVVGKALGSLESGRGLVPILIALQ